MIDPIEAVIKSLAANAGIQAKVGTRVAAKHEYGGKWSIDQTGLAVRLDAGDIDRYLPMGRHRVELRAYASSQPEAVSIMLAVIGWCRAVERTVIAVTGGNALVYWALPASGISALNDPDTGMDMAMLFLEVGVAEETVVV